MRESRRLWNIEVWIIGKCTKELSDGWMDG